MRPMVGSARQAGRVAAAVLVAATFAVAGCSAGQITQTDSQAAAVNGDQAGVGQLRISNAVLAYPEGDVRHWAAGSDVPLSMSIANGGSENDQLQSVSSPDADEVSISGDKVIVAQKALTVGGDPAGKLGEADAATGSGDLGKATIVLENIKRDLFPGQIVRVRMVFSDAGDVELRVPIAAPDYVRTAEPKEEEGAH